MSNIEREEEVFRGKLIECFHHYLDKLPMAGTRNAGRAKEPLAEYVGVTVDTVTRWRSKLRPLGMARHYLACFLMANGYIVTEHDRLPESARRLVELVGFKILEVRDLATRLRYKNVNDLYTLFRGEHNLLPEKDGIAFQIFKDNREELERRKSELRDKFLRVTQHDSSGETTPMVQPSSEAIVRSSERTPAYLTSLMILAATEQLASFNKDANAGDRQELLERTGQLGPSILQQELSKLQDAYLKDFREMSRRRE